MGHGCWLTRPLPFVPSEEAMLLRPPRLLRYELQRALCESHLWLSLFQRPPRSPFTRLQRATCCALLLQLLLLANTLWYSIVVDVRYRCRHLSFSRAVSSFPLTPFQQNCCFLFCPRSPRPVSRFASLSGETVAVGVVTCLVAYPLYLLVFTLFRMSRSKVRPTDAC